MRLKRIRRKDKRKQLAKVGRNNKTTRFIGETWMEKENRKVLFLIKAKKGMFG